MELLLTGVAAAFSAVIGVAIGMWIRREQAERHQERLSYAAQELLRRKGGALMADLREKRGQS